MPDHYDEEQGPFPKDIYQGKPPGYFLEPSLVIGSGMAGEILGGLGGLAALPFGGPEAGAHVVEYIQNQLQYEPRSPGGQQGMEDLGSAIQRATQAVSGATHGYVDPENMAGYWNERVVPALQEQFGTEGGSAYGAGGLGALATLFWPARRTRAVRRPDFGAERQEELFPEIPGGQWAGQEDRPFYSGLEKAAYDVKQEKGTRQQMLNLLKKDPRVKPDELRYSGVEEYLLADPAAKMTKKELIDLTYTNRYDLEIQRWGSGVDAVSTEDLQQYRRLEQARDRTRNDLQQLKIYGNPELFRLNEMTTAQDTHRTYQLSNTGTRDGMIGAQNLIDQAYETNFDLIDPNEFSPTDPRRVQYEALVAGKFPEYTTQSRLSRIQDEMGDPQIWTVYRTMLDPAIEGLQTLTDIANRGRISPEGFAGNELFLRLANREGEFEGVPEHKSLALQDELWKLRDAAAAAEQAKERFRNFAGTRGPADGPWGGTQTMAEDSSVGQGELPYNEYTIEIPESQYPKIGIERKHFGERPILHVRYTSLSNKRPDDTLLVDEIQSDIHGKAFGRYVPEGYRDVTPGDVEIRQIQGPAGYSINLRTQTPEGPKHLPLTRNREQMAQALLEIAPDPLVLKQTPHDHPAKIYERTGANREVTVREIVDKFFYYLANPREMNLPEHTQGILGLADRYDDPARINEDMFNATRALNHSLRDVLTPLSTSTFQNKARIDHTPQDNVPQFQAYLPKEYVDNMELTTEPRRTGTGNDDQGNPISPATVAARAGREIVQDADGNIIIGNNVTGEIDEIERLVEQYNHKRHVYANQKRLTKDIPYKQKAQRFDVALKSLLHTAAREGRDYVSILSGQGQSDRWSTSERVERIAFDTDDQQLYVDYGNGWETEDRFDTEALFGAPARRDRDGRELPPYKGYFNDVEVGEIKHDIGLAREQHYNDLLENQGWVLDNQLEGYQSAADKVAELQSRGLDIERGVVDHEGNFFMDDSTRHGYWKSRFENASVNERTGLMESDEIVEENLKKFEDEMRLAGQEGRGSWSDAAYQLITPGGGTDIYRGSLRHLVDDYKQKRDDARVYMEADHYADTRFDVMDWLDDNGAYLQVDDKIPTSKMGNTFLRDYDDILPQRLKRLIKKEKLDKLGVRFTDDVDFEDQIREHATKDEASHPLTIELTPEAREKILREGFSAFDPGWGAAGAATVAGLVGGGLMAGSPETQAEEMVQNAFQPSAEGQTFGLTPEEQAAVDNTRDFLHHYARPAISDFRERRGRKQGQRGSASLRIPYSPRLSNLSRLLEGNVYEMEPGPSMLTEEQLIEGGY